jgi:hypothetical protein
MVQNYSRAGAICCGCWCNALHLQIYVDSGSGRAVKGRTSLGQGFPWHDFNWGTEPRPALLTPLRPSHLPPTSPIPCRNDQYLSWTQFLNPWKVEYLGEFRTNTLKVWNINILTMFKSSYRKTWSEAKTTRWFPSGTYFADFPLVHTAEIFSKYFVDFLTSAFTFPNFIYIKCAR